MSDVSYVVEDGVLESFHETVRVMTITHAVDLWLGELERHGHSERTIDTYARLLGKLSHDFPRIDVGEITATQIRRFLDEQAKTRGGARKAPATIAQNVTVVNRFFDWLTAEAVVKRNPTRRNGDRILARPRQQSADDNDNITTISGSDVWKLIETAGRRGHWNEMLAVNVLAYMGPRRGAVNAARIGDYDPVERMLRFHEKGGKTIAKPVPHPLADLIDAAIAAGVYEQAVELGRGDYLIPGRAQQRRPGVRSDKIIWNLVRTVAEDAGVTTHVHALRAAFAIDYLEEHPGEVVSLKDLLGHKRMETTLVYLRRRDRRAGMETVRSMDWGSKYGKGEIRTRAAGFPTERLSRAPLSATQPPSQKQPVCEESLVSSQVIPTLVLEPSMVPNGHEHRAGLQSEASVPLDEALRAVLPRPTADAQASRPRPHTEGSVS